MPELFGHTRARVAARHALMTPDNHVASMVPGISGARVIVLINEAMGAKFAQLLVIFEKEGRASLEQPGVQTFGYVMSGALTVRIAGRTERCSADGFFFVPAGQACELVSPKAATQIILFQKRYDAIRGLAVPEAIIGAAGSVKGAPFLGDPAAELKVLLPDEPAFDMAVNIFTYQPGGHLPFVEIHVMEHGLIMLEGQGIYRLEDNWYPVQAGDVVWMAPYCAQWFVAMGRKPARYLYYKDVNRAVL